MIRVALVDDQQLVRAGFAMVIDSQPDLEVVLQCGDGAEAVTEIPTANVDIVLMDVRMPGVDGITATEQLTARSEGDAAPKVIMLTTFDLDEYVMRAIKAGASGFLLKDTPPEAMLDAIRTVQAGDAVMAPSSTKRLLDHLVGMLPDEERATPAALDVLTDREREVLVLMARGLSNQEIAAELYVAEATVKTHVGRILMKLDARDRVQAVVVAYETGLVTPGH